jgi:ribosomal-protein-alanine N-acetyltransferase
VWTPDDKRFRRSRRARPVLTWLLFLGRSEAAASGDFASRRCFYHRTSIHEAGQYAVSRIHGRVWRLSRVLSAMQKSGIIKALRGRRAVRRWDDTAQDVFRGWGKLSISVVLESVHRYSRSMLPFDKPSALKSNRLLLRSPTVTDAGPLFAEYTSDPQIVRWLPWQRHRSVEETSALITQSVDAGAARSNYLFAIVRQEEEAMPLGLLNFGGSGHCVSLGFGLARHSWGRGYATEVACATAEWLLDQPLVWRVWAYCDTENAASARVLEQVGMTCEGTAWRYAVHPNVSATPRDCYLFARVKS